MNYMGTRSKVSNFYEENYADRKLQYHFLVMRKMLLFRSMHYWPNHVCFHFAPYHLESMKRYRGCVRSHTNTLSHIAALSIYVLMAFLFFLFLLIDHIKKAT